MSCIHFIAEDTCSLCAGIKQMGGTDGYGAGNFGSQIITTIKADQTNRNPVTNSIFCYGYSWFRDHEFDSSPESPYWTRRIRNGNQS